MTVGTLYGIGVGPGDPELLTLKALRILQAVPVVYVPVSRPGARSMARSIIDAYLEPTRQLVVDLVIEMHDNPAGLDEQWHANAVQVAAHLATGADAAYITEGDALLYSTLNHLVEALTAVLPSAPIVVVPGISSISAVAAATRTMLSERDDRIAIVPATYGAADLKILCERFETVVLMKVASVIDQVLDVLEEQGISDRAVCVSRCGLPGEEIVTDVRSLRGRKLDYFSTLIMRNRP